MTVALEAGPGAAQTWQLEGIDQLTDPLIVVPAAPDVVTDMQFMQEGLRTLDPKEGHVTQASINEASALIGYAKDAALAHNKIGALERLPDLDSPAVRAVGWKWIPRDDLVDWHDRLVHDIQRSAAPVYIDGAPAEAARLGLLTLAEVGDGESDPVLLAALAGHIAAKYSGAQAFNIDTANEARRSATAELDEACERGDGLAISRIWYAQRWLTQHTVIPHGSPLSSAHSVQ